MSQALDGAKEHLQWPKQRPNRKQSSFGGSFENEMKMTCSACFHINGLAVHINMDKTRYAATAP